MSLKTTLQRAASQALKQADSLAVDASYIQKGAATHTAYDPVTGTLTETESSQSIRAIMVSITQKEVDQLGLKLSDKKAIWDRKGFGFEVNVEDVIDIQGGENTGRWEIIQTLAEPSESIFIAVVRRP